MGPQIDHHTHTQDILYQVRITYILDLYVDFWAIPVLQAARD